MVIKVGSLKVKTLIVHTGCGMTKLMENDYCDEYFFIDLSSNSFFYRVFRKMTYKLLSKFWVKYIFFKYRKYTELNIILFDSFQNNYWCREIKKQFPTSKVIFWLWNRIYDDNTINYIKLNSDLVATFDKQQSIEDEIYYHTQFLPYKSNRLKELKACLKYDVVFVGSDKGRLQELFNLSDILSKSRITYIFKIFTKEFFLKRTNIDKIDKLLSYNDVLSLYSKSRCILDLCQEGQIGLTLRPIEALFMGKKIITNNKSIIDCTIYNKNNIFVLGVDNISKLDEFLKCSYEENYSRELDVYSVNSWINKLISYEC